MFLLERAGDVNEFNVFEAKQTNYKYCVLLNIYIIMGLTSTHTQMPTATHTHTETQTVTPRDTLY